MIPEFDAYMANVLLFQSGVCGFVHVDLSFALLNSYERCLLL